MTDVTEDDFRQPQYRGAKVEDYEFRQDGVLVRKDRWERGMRSIAYIILGDDGRQGFEIEEIVAAVAELYDRTPDNIP